MLNLNDILSNFHTQLCAKLTAYMELVALIHSSVNVIRDGRENSVNKVLSSTLVYII